MPLPRQSENWPAAPQKSWPSGGKGEATFLLSWNDQVLLANMVSPAFWRGNILPGQPLYYADRTRDAQQGIAAAGFRFYNQDTRQGWGQWAGLVTGWPEAVSVRLTGPEAPEPMEAALQPTGKGDRYFWIHGLTQERRSAPPTPKSPSSARQDAH